MTNPQRLLSVGVILASLVSPLSYAQAEATFQESVNVVRYLVDVRVTDASGMAIPDLAAADFAARLGGKVATVESATWVGVERPVSPSGRETAGRTIQPAPSAAAEAPRSIVFFVLTDFARNPSRIKGQLKFNLLLDPLLELLQPADRVAVLSFDSHLKLRLDLTDDREAARRAVHDSIRLEDVTPPSPGALGRSLARSLESDAMLRVVSAESALLLISRALTTIEGDKTLILVGWGLGNLLVQINGSFQHHLLPEWYVAIDELQRQRIPVITLDTGGGQLAVGLAKTSKRTGGLYASVVDSFPAQALTRVAGELAGHYELALRTERELEPGYYSIDVRALRKDAFVRASTSLKVDPDRRRDACGTAGGPPAFH